MNSTYRVIYSKARNALMVVNELTSCVQAKGTKTVIAVAAAAAMGSAVAADAVEDATPLVEEETPVVDTSLWTDKTVSKAETVKDGETIKINTAVIAEGGSLTVQGNVDRDPKEVNGEKTSVLSVEKGGKVAVEATGNLQVNDLKIAGDVTAAGKELVDEEHGRTTPAIGAYKSFEMTDGTLTLSQGGRAWIGSTWSKDPAAYDRMELKGGEVTLKDGGYITGNKRFVKADKYYGDEKDGHDTVKVEKDTLAANVIGLDGAAVKAEGKGNVIDAAKTELTAGSLTIKKDGELTVRASTATNEPEDTQDEAKALIAEQGYFAVKGGTMSVEEGASFFVANSLKRVEVTGGSIDNAGTFGLGEADMTLENAAFTNTGKLESTGKLTIGQGGALSTAASKSEAFDMKGGVVLNEGGKLTFTALNSTFEDPRTPAAQAEDGAEEAPAEPVEKPKDQLLIAGTDYTLAGGVLEGADTIKIGRNDDAASMKITKGDYTFKNVRLGNSTKTDGASTLTVAGGNLTVTDLLDLRYGKTTVESGKLTLEGDYLFDEKHKGTFEVAGGTFATTGANLFKVKAETQAEDAAGEEEKPAAPKYEVSDLVTNGLYTDGIIEVTDEGLELSQADVKAAVKKLKDAGVKSSLVFADVTFTDDKLVFDDALGLNGKGQVIEAAPSAEGVTTLSITDTTAAVGQLVVDDKTTSITVAKGNGNAIGVLQLTGTEAGGNLIVGGASTGIKTLTANDVKLGWDNASVGTLNVETLDANSLTVVGDFTAQGKVVTKNSFNLEEGAKLEATEVQLGQTSNLIAGYLKADKVTDYKPAGGMSLYSTGTEVTGTMETHNFDATSTFKEGATLSVYGKNVEADGKTTWEAAQVTGTATIEKGALFTTNANAAHVADKAVAYIDDTVEIGANGQVVLGTATGAAGALTGAAGALTVGTDGLLMVDASAFTEEKAAIEGTLKMDGGAVEFENLNKAGSFKLADALTGEVAAESDNVFLGVSVDEQQGEQAPAGVFVTTTANEKVSSSAALNAASVRIMNGYGNDSVREVLAAIGDKNADMGFVTAEGTGLTDLGAAVAEEFLALPVTAGTYNVAYDAMSQVTRAVAKKNVSGEGMGVWADVFYASNEAETLYNGQQGYSADIYGGVLGFDTTFSCGAKLGVALTVGTGDADSEKSISKFSNDADFWGLSLYTGKNVADTKLYVGLDLSYLWIDNDVKGTVAGVKADESLDSTAFSVGLTADWTAYEGAFSIVPHAGIRYTAIDVDDYRGLASESVNVLELPVGVKFTGSFETAGWTFVPALDFTVVPQIGDTEVDTVVGAVDVIDNTYNTTIGFEAKNGNIAFGLNAGYGFGNEDRKNATVNANVRYSF